MNKCPFVFVKKKKGKVLSFKKRRR